MQNAPEIPGRPHWPYMAQHSQCRDRASPSSLVPGYLSLSLSLSNSSCPFLGYGSLPSCLHAPSTCCSWYWPETGFSFQTPFCPLGHLHLSHCHVVCEHTSLSLFPGNIKHCQRDLLDKIGGCPYIGSSTEVERRALGMCLEGWMWKNAMCVKDRGHN